MSTPARPIPTWFLALLVADIVLAVLVVLLGLASIGLTSGYRPGMEAGLIVLAIMAGLFAAVIALAWWLQSRGHNRLAVAAALLPPLFLLPIGPLLFGFGIF